MTRSSAPRSFSPAEGTVRPSARYRCNRAAKEAGMNEKSKSETDEKAKHDEKDEELEHELEDTFPASDPPSMTQPSVKTGAPNHEKKAK
jgi:hypothetical protein